MSYLSRAHRSQDCERAGTSGTSTQGKGTMQHDHECGCTHLSVHDLEPRCCSTQKQPTHCDTPSLPLQVAEADVWSMLFLIKAPFDVGAHVLKDAYINITHLLPPLSTCLDVALLQIRGDINNLSSDPTELRRLRGMQAIATQHMLAAVQARQMAYRTGRCWLLYSCVNQ
eukprot:GHUV01042842.1.p1 GENE.GHUV01042842.1~~GHUV01042842.1.p1  ORF type:complete len:170 (+),score=32.99 GHUV01042842.1:148-657(+)